MDAYLIVATLKINLRENCGSAKLIKHIILVWYGVTITHSNTIDRTAVGIDVKCTIFHGNKDYRDVTRAQTFSNMAIVDELLYLPLDLLSFFGVDVVWSFVWKGRSGDEVDSMLNAS